MKIKKKEKGTMYLQMILSVAINMQENNKEPACRICLKWVFSILYYLILICVTNHYFLLYWERSTLSMLKLFVLSEENAFMVF